MYKLQTDSRSQLMIEGEQFRLQSLGFLWEAIVMTSARFRRKRQQEQIGCNLPALQSAGGVS